MRRERGYNLIEIVLVLAIAGLILVVVFFAVSGSQRARRDSQRKADLARMVAAVTKWSANNQNQTPSTQAQLDDVHTNYIDNLADPKDSAPYTIVFRPPGAAPSAVPPVGTMYYQQGQKCAPGTSSDPISGTGTELAQFAVWSGQEAGGNGTGAWYCLDNH